MSTSLPFATELRPNKDKFSQGAGRGEVHDRVVLVYANFSLTVLHQNSTTSSVSGFRLQDLRQKKPVLTVC